MTSVGQPQKDAASDGLIKFQTMILKKESLFKPLDIGIWYLFVICFLGFGIFSNSLI